MEAAAPALPWAQQAASQLKREEGEHLYFSVLPLDQDMQAKCRNPEFFSRKGLLHAKAGRACPSQRQSRSVRICAKGTLPSSEGDGSAPMSSKEIREQIFQMHVLSSPDVGP